MKYNLFKGLLMIQRYPAQCLFFLPRLRVSVVNVCRV